MNKRAYTIILMSFLLSGCGFHLQNHWTIAPQFSCLQLSTPNRYSNFTRKLRQTMADNHVRLIDERLNSNSSRCPNLTITKVELKNDSPTIGTINTARVFRYYLVVEYHIDNRPTQGIITSRFTTLNAGILTTTNNQVHLVEQGLIDDAIRQLLNRLSVT